MKGGEIAGACNTHEIGEGMHVKFASETMKGRDHLGYLNMEEKMILKWMLKKYGVWIRLVQDSE